MSAFIVFSNTVLKDPNGHIPLTFMHHLTVFIPVLQVIVTTNEQFNNDQRDDECKLLRGASMYDTQRRGLCPNAHIVVKLSMGSCMNLRTSGEGVKNTVISTIKNPRYLSNHVFFCVTPHPTSRSEDIIWHAPVYT